MSEDGRWKIQSQGDTRWKLDAACIGQPTEWFFPPKRVTPWRALAICATCSVAEECGDYARRNNEVGVWGGLAENHTPGRRNQNSHKTECKAGHPFTDENTYVWDGRRQCKLCKAVQGRERRMEAWYR